MKAILIIFNQAITEEVVEVLEKTQTRGFTKFSNLQGRGSQTGVPHMGTHTWPSLNNGILAVVPEEKEDPLLTELKKINASAEDQGLKAFSWSVETAIT